jgi:hypothetical protein
MELFSNALNITGMADQLEYRVSGLNAHIMTGLARLANDILYQVAGRPILGPLYPWVLKQFSWIMNGKFLEGDTVYSGKVPFSVRMKELGMQDSDSE